MLGKAGGHDGTARAGLQRQAKGRLLLLVRQMGRRLLLRKGGHCVRIVGEWLARWTLRSDGIRGLRMQRIAGVVGVHPGNFLGYFFFFVSRPGCGEE